MLEPFESMVEVLNFWFGFRGTIAFWSVCWFQGNDSFLFKYSVRPVWPYNSKVVMLLCRVINCVHCACYWDLSICVVTTACSWQRNSMNEYVNFDVICALDRGWRISESQVYRFCLCTLACKALSHSDITHRQYFNVKSSIEFTVYI